MFYANAKYLARRMKIEEFVVQQTTNWTFLKKKCQACSDNVNRYSTIRLFFQTSILLI